MSLVGNESEEGHDDCLLTECCQQCASMKLASEDAQEKDFGEADIYVYKCEAGDDAVCHAMQALHTLHVL